MNILIAITAKNEELTIRDTIVSIRFAIVAAEQALGVSYELNVVLNDSTDKTVENIPPDISIITTVGGIVEAQRAVANMTSFVIFSDADILVSPEALIEVTRAMKDDSDLAVAYPNKIPLNPVNSSWLAKALYTYNKNHGFENTRLHFNGKFFAIRNWDIPKKQAFQNLNGDPLWSLQNGVIADDIYLSKSILFNLGAEAIQQTDGVIYYQAPASFKGMYQYFRRMKIELKRVELLFPDLYWHKGAERKTDFAKLKSACSREKFDWMVFQLALRFCNLRFWWEKKRVHEQNRSLGTIWEPIEETKSKFKKNLTRLKLENRHSLEIWDVLIDGKTLWEWQEHADYIQKLELGLEAIKTGSAHTKSKGKVLRKAKDFEKVFFTGGRSRNKKLRGVFSAAQFSENSIFEASEAALARWPDALVIDVGQTQIKISYGEKRETFARDYDLLPVGKHSKKGSLLDYIKQSLPSIQPEHIILALPCYIHDDLTLGGSSYAEMKQNPTLLHDLTLTYPTAKWQVINDAELATLCVNDCREKTLVLTLGFGIGGCIVEPT